jgi:transposase
MTTQHSVIVGIDLGDRYSHLCLLGAENGEVIEEGRIATSKEAFGRHFSGAEPMLVAIETGTHSP